MRKLFFLPLLTLALACGDGNPLQPDDQASLTSEQPGLMVSQAPGQNAKRSFNALGVFVEAVEVGEAWVSPGGILHANDIVNKFALSGDLEGFWYFAGDYMANLESGKGRSRGRPVLFEVMEEDGLVGTFECVGTFKLEDMNTAYIQYGNISGCHGTGIFDGKSMKAYSTNELYAGESTYDLWGDIW